jgi:hypothetical protein
VSGRVPRRPSPVAAASRPRFTRLVSLRSSSTHASQLPRDTVCRRARYGRPRPSGEAGRRNPRTGLVSRHCDPSRFSCRTGATTPSPTAWETLHCCYGGPYHREDPGTVADLQRADDTVRRMAVVVVPTTRRLRTVSRSEQRGDPTAAHRLQI